MRKLTLPTLAVVTLALALAGAASAGASPLAPLEPAGPNARAIADVYWIVFAVTLALLVLLVLALGAALARGGGRGPLARPAAARDPGSGGGHRVLGSSAIPVAGLVVVAVVSFARLGDARDAPAPASGAATVEVKVQGSQAGWTYDYGKGITATDRLRVPTGALVRLAVSSSDVQHAFWVPQLAGQVRVFPGESRTLAFRADRDGLFEGRSTVPSGPGSRNMGISVEAMSKADYEAWLAQAGSPGDGS